MAKQKQEVRICERSISLSVARAEVDAVVSAVASLASSKFEVWSEEQMRIEEQTMGVRAASYARPVEALEIQQIVSAVLHEVKERAVVDKPITEAEVVALLEASH